jgi:hypothetical protein
VGVDRQPGSINQIDQVTKVNAFLAKRNIESKIISASTILSQQHEINFLASNIVELRLSESHIHEALNLLMSNPTVAAFKPAHSSNVNVMTTKAPPNFCGVITSAEVAKLVRYSNLLGTEIVNLRPTVDKDAIYTIEIHLSSRGYLCGFNKPIDYEKWLDWDHRRFTEFMVILFGEYQTKLDKSMDLHANIIKFNFGLNDKDRLGDIRNEQKLLFELSQLLENDINPKHTTEAGQLELVRLIHRNLTPNKSIMLAINYQPEIVMDYHLIRHSLVRIMILLSLLLNRRDRREMIILERKSLFLSRPVGLVVSKATLELNATRVHTLIEIRRMCPSRRALLVRDGLQSSHQDLT